MPALVVAAAASYAGYAAAAYAVEAGIAAAGSFAAAAISAAAATATAVAGNALLSRNANNGALTPQEARSVIRQAAAPRRLIFGTTQVGGVLACPPLASTADPSLANLVVIFGEGEIDGIEPVFWIGEKLSTDAVFTGLVDAWFNTGRPTQSAFASLIAERSDVWTTDHRLQGIACAHVRLKFDANAFPSGLPALRFLARGLKLYDPRTGTTALSNNPALVVLYYLRSPLGLRCPDALIDFASFSAAANVCDEVVASADASNTAFGVAGKVKRYTLDGVVDLSAGRAAILRGMEGACAGKLVFTQGQYRFYAGAFDEPHPVVVTGDMLRADPQFRARPQRSTLFNIASGKYIEPRQDWQEADFAPQRNAAAIAADGDEIVQGLSFPYTIIGATAQRLAALALARVRNAATLSLQCNWSAVQFRVWDMVLVDLPEIDISMQPFRVQKFAFAEGGGIDLVLQAEAEADYAWSASQEVIVRDVAKPDNSINGQPDDIAGLVVSGAPRIEQYGTVPLVSATWTAATGAGLSGYEVQIKASASGTWGDGFAVSLPSWQTQFVTFGTTYDVRVRSLFTGGRYSNWATVTGTLVLNDTSAPGAPTSLSVTGTGTHTVHWTTPADDDFKKCNVYSNTSNTSVGATMVASVTGLTTTAYTASFTPGGTRYYFVSSVDRTGNESALTYAGTGT